MSLKNEELMPFKKYVQTLLGELYHEDTVMLNGTFRDMKTGKITKNDIFEAHFIGRKSLKETYKTYLKWCNYVKQDFEHEREFVSVKLTEVKKCFSI